MLNPTIYFCKIIEKIEKIHRATPACSKKINLAHSANPGIVLCLGQPAIVSVSWTINLFRNADPGTTQLILDWSDSGSYIPPTSKS
jgi:hypothetical protein